MTMMKKLLLVWMLIAALTCSAFAEEAPAATYPPLTWGDDPAPYPLHEECLLPDNLGYHDDSLDITTEIFRRYDTTILVVRVKLQDASQIRAAWAGRHPSSKQTTLVTNMAKRYNAVLAINGDYFNYHNEGIVVRNGKELRNRPTTKRDTLIIDDKGDFHIIVGTTKELWEAYDGTVMHAFAFGPGLVVDGVPMSQEFYNDIKLNVGKGKQTQRIVLAQTGPLEYMIIATEGPENANSVGLTLLEMSELCVELGCINAYNLDGGSSSTVVLNYEKINALSTGKIRDVGDCIYFATLVPNE